MILLHPLIDDSKNTCGKLDRKTLTTFPQALLLLWWRVPTIGHLYFALTGISEFKYMQI
jgi:hypothetical protein